MSTEEDLFTSAEWERRARRLQADLEEIARDVKGLVNQADSEGRYHDIKRIAKAAIRVSCPARQTTYPEGKASGAPIERYHCANVRDHNGGHRFELDAVEAPPIIDETEASA